jgi:metallophosphoesterase (TIGR00282 family)
MKILFIGDVIGRSGRQKIRSDLSAMVERESISFTIVQGENCAGGIGITERTANELLDAGVDCITTGNHVWKHKEMYHYLAKESRVLRPANYPAGVPGQGYQVYKVNGSKIAVINLQGRAYMDCIDNPFIVGKNMVAQIKEETPNIFIDFHAEATSEKRALAFYLAGSVTGIFGTHTHIPTADEQIMDEYTAYITDVGMVGSVDSVIGECKEEVIDHFLLSIPQKFRVEKHAVVAQCVVVDFDASTGKACSIVRVTF